MKRWLALGLVVGMVGPVWAKGDKKPKTDDDSDDDSSESDSGDSGDHDGDKKPDKKKPAKKADKKADKTKPEKKADDDSESDDSKGSDSDDDSAPSDKGRDKTTSSDDEGETTKSSDEPVKQDLTGHDLGTKKKTNEFERDRFFVDKTDTDATENGTLIQGSITSSSFAYHESSGALANSAGSNGADDYSRLFTDLRLQTDFRHIKASRWEARIDARIRLVNGEPPANESTTGATTTPATNLQSGLTGQNEYELRELWLIRNGERTDVILGRQFINDLAAVKIDGLRIDYASSNRLTYLGFAGLYPLRGSRSITTDYIDSKDPTTGAPISPFVGSAGFGAAYRTPTAYGAFGGVALVPFEEEQPRIFATSNGYYRVNPKLDFYHFALIDLIAASGAQVTNLSAGLNVKPAQRLRLTASFNRVDTDSLNIQAQSFLDTPQANPVVQNNLMLQRLATNQARGSISAGLGPNERFELTVATTYRERPDVTLTTTNATPNTTYTLPAAKGVEVYGSVTDRYSIKGARLGIDALETFGVGEVAYQRDETTAYRVFASRELDSGHGEWEAELAYANNKDSNAGITCNALTDLATCFGSTTSTVLSIGGTLYYRVNRDWFLIASAYLSRTQLTVAAMAADPTITGLSGYLRFSHRF